MTPSKSKKEQNNLDTKKISGLSVMITAIFSLPSKWKSRSE